MMTKGPKVHIEKVFFTAPVVKKKAKSIDVHLYPGEFILNAFFDQGKLWVVSNKNRTWKSTEVNPKYLDLIEVSK